MSDSDSSGAREAIPRLRRRGQHQGARTKWPDQSTPRPRPASESRSRSTSRSSDGQGGQQRTSSSSASRSSSSVSILDLLRLLTGLVLLSSSLSYFITNESLTWNYGLPVFLRNRSAFLAWARGPSLRLTPAELLSYNGSDASMPIYLAINGTIYDVSASPHYYGPGAGYGFFSGRDGTRAFVTGCFGLEHVVPDLRGAEDVWLAAEGPVSEEERRAALEKVTESVRHWEAFFRNSAKYFEVGKVLTDPAEMDRQPMRPLCDEAERMRPKPKT